MRLFCGFCATSSDFFARFDTFIARAKTIAERAFLSGVTEIRTREPLVTVTRFPGVIVLRHKCGGFQFVVIIGANFCAHFAVFSRILPNFAKS